MAWTLKGTIYECCSCKMACRCALGPAEPDQGWCSALNLVEVESGSLDGTELAGARCGLQMELPGDFFGGIDRARLYFDDGTTTPAQRAALESIYQGRAGGFWVDLQANIREWLPSKVARIDVTSDGERVDGSVAGAVELHLQFVKTADGKQAALVNAPVAAALGITQVDMALANGSRVTDPDLRGWESLGWGGRSSFVWRS